jgi:hypothetical protein
MLSRDFGHDQSSKGALSRIGLRHLRHHPPSWSKCWLKTVNDEASKSADPTSRCLLDPQLRLSADLSDISQVFEVDNILWVRVGIS